MSQTAPTDLELTMPRRQTPPLGRDPHHAALMWSATHSEGTPVRYYPRKGSREFRETTTRSAAWVMGGHSAMVMVEGVSGGVSLDHVVAV